MHILLTGGTGFIGSALADALISEGHSLTILSRQIRENTDTIQFIPNLDRLPNFNNIDVVINLAGEPIFNHRWTKAHKHVLRQSRLTITQQIIERIQASHNPPHTFLSGSATGYYGNLSDNEKNKDEQTACHSSFPAQLCKEWENLALQAQSPKTRVCLLRTGMVLDQTGGALKQILPLYRLGLGGKIGTGKQHWAWISLYDQIQAILFLLHTSSAQGAFNLVSPESVRQYQFNQFLAQAVSRPALFSTPRWIIKLLLGERANLLLDNQPLIPQKLLQLGFQFRDHNLKIWLREHIKNKGE